MKYNIIEKVNYSYEENLNIKCCLMAYECQLL